MNALIAGFPGQLERAMEIGENAKISQGNNAIHNVLVTGLGGSGIGGTIVSQIADKWLKIPMLVNKNYFMPSFVNEHSVVIVSSYSGNTEETLHAMKEAFSRDARVICITSGGKIMEFAKCNGLDYIEIDGGMPPRACFGYSFVQQLYILLNLGLIDDSFRQELRSAIQLLKTRQPAIMEEAKAVADKLADKLPIIYTDADWEGVGIRFCQQINENAKKLCWHNMLPEMNHNELVGWRSDSSDKAVVFLRNASDYERNQKRMEFTASVAAEYNATLINIFSKGSTDIEKAMYLIHLTDWVSKFMADINGMDSMEVHVIDRLKNELGKTPLN